MSSPIYNFKGIFARRVVLISIVLSALVLAIYAVDDLKEEPGRLKNTGQNIPQMTSNDPDSTVKSPAPEVPASGGFESVSVKLHGIIQSTTPGASSAMVRINEGPSTMIKGGDSLASGVAVLEIGADFLVYGNAERRELVRLQSDAEKPSLIAKEQMMPGFVKGPAVNSTSSDPALPNGNKAFIEAINARVGSPR